MDKILAILVIILLLGAVYLLSMWIRSTFEDIKDKFQEEAYDYYCEGVFNNIIT